MTLPFVPVGIRSSLTELLWYDLQRYYILLGRDDGLTPRGLLLWLNLFSPRIAPVFIYRLSHYCYKLHFGFAAKFLSCLNQFLFGIEIASACPIGPGLFLPHTQGTVIGAAAIGSNVTIFQGVTLGAKSLDFDYSPCLRPKLGSGVTVGAGAKVIGHVFIGDNSTIGANAVVVSDLPDNCTAVGIPAKPL